MSLLEIRIVVSNCYKRSYQFISVKSETPDTWTLLMSRDGDVVLTSISFVFSLVVTTKGCFEKHYCPPITESNGWRLLSVFTFILVCLYLSLTYSFHVQVTYLYLFNGLLPYYEGYFPFLLIMYFTVPIQRVCNTMHFLRPCFLVYVVLG